LGNNQNREWLSAILSAGVDDTKKNSHCNSDCNAESDKVPERRESKDKNQDRAHSKEQARELSTDRQFVHGNSGMEFVGHGRPPFEVNDGISPQTMQLFSTCEDVEIVVRSSHSEKKS
jgi:hypothetical protein